MMNSKSTLLLILLVGIGLNLRAQSERDFYGTVIDKTVCLRSASGMPDEEVAGLISEILSRFGAQNRYIILNCAQISNCLATKDDEGRQYILYNAAFLNRVKTLKFTNSTLPTGDRDWQVLTILAHELGHHINNHITNPLPRATSIDKELEADETAGFLMYLLKAGLAQAQSVMYDKNVTEEGSYTHPPRQKRLDAIAKGYNKAKELYKVDPKPTENADSILSGLTLHVKRDFNARQGDLIAFNYYLQGPDQYLDQIHEVRYVRNHKTFPEFAGSYQASRTRTSNFNFSSYQWGQIENTFVTIVLVNGSMSKRMLLKIVYDN
ncbi:MAG: hypothetical protein ACOYXT_28815 [Bacteroidota bacterium]